jgi:outer membrane protein
MQKIVLATTIAALATLAQPAVAQVKVAVFDAQNVINNTAAAKRAVSSLKSKRESAQKRINDLEAPLLQKRQQLAEQQGVLAADKFKAAQESFAKDLAGFRAQALGIQEDLDKENLKFRKQISDAVRDVVAEIAKAKGYDVVLPKSVTFFAAPTVPDISSEVLTKVDAKLK